ncbi:hypothetical protein DRO66_00600 [Candidatus Bathyarchaeota archaeon]|nr:MAG: hypothetical protein DRO66_00600 [Candidatus Bathyarchaeota archaeon]
MSAFTIEKGATVRDDTDGFQGMVTSRSDHLNGCNRYWVQPPVDENGKTRDGQWIDEPSLIMVKKPTTAFMNRRKKYLKNKAEMKEQDGPGGFRSSIK